MEDRLARVVTGEAERPRKRELGPERSPWQLGWKADVFFCSPPGQQVDA